MHQTPRQCAHSRHLSLFSSCGSIWGTQYYHHTFKWELHMILLVLSHRGTVYSR
jgi:hypothetical protein